MVDDLGHMHFRRMDAGTDADFAVLKRVHDENIRKLPNLVMGLLTDLKSDGPLNHGEVVASVLKPFVSEANHWMLEHHPVFQVYFYGSHLGIDPNQRDRYRGNPYFDCTAEFCACYDEVSFDPDYPSEPMSTFEPMVRRILAKRWTPPA
jgi:predicted HD phosphohydrolase